MSYYVTVKGGPGQVCWAAGPFNRLGDAERMIAPVRLLTKDYKESDWLAYGTARVKSGPLLPGRFNVRLGLPERTVVLDQDVPQGRWTMGDHLDPLAYLTRHDSTANARRAVRHLEHNGHRQKGQACQRPSTPSSS